MTKIVVRYHVGIRHYAATDPYAAGRLRPRTASAQVNAAMNAADGSASMTTAQILGMTDMSWPGGPSG